LQPSRRPQRPVPADHDEGLDARRLYGRPDRLVAFAVDERVHAGRPEDGAALVEDPPDVVPGEGTDEAFHQPSPPLHDAHAFAAVTYDSGDDATDRGIQARTVTSCSEHPHLH